MPLGPRANHPHKHDEGKNRLELIPPQAILDIGEVFTYGATRYPAWSWVDVPKIRLYAAALRHLLAWRNGERMDVSGHNHLAHAAANLMMLMALDKEDEHDYHRPDDPVDH